VRQGDRDRRRMVSLISVVSGNWALLIYLPCILASRKVTCGAYAHGTGNNDNHKLELNISKIHCPLSSDILKIG
jgi:hypothetical protein